MFRRDRSQGQSVWSDCLQSGWILGMASEERRCFGVRAAERSVNAALVLPEETNPLTPNQDPNQFNCKP